MFYVEARPDPLSLEAAKTAVVLVDMQNDFGAEGGMFERAGIPISAIQSTVAPTARVLAAARGAGIQVVYLTMQFEPDLSDAGGADAPNSVLHRKLGLGDPVKAPDGREGRILVRDTWNTEILSQLSPEDGDIVVPKHRFSGFFETDLDAILKERGITSLIFTGCTTSVCVESTLRDAFFRDYRCLLLEDCCAEPIGGDLVRSNHDASVLTIQALFGSVSDASRFEAALSVSTAGAA
jgi:ureidoacrylate peracid hydrolase